MNPAVTIPTFAWALTFMSCTWDARDDSPTRRREL